MTSASQVVIERSVGKRRGGGALIRSARPPDGVVERLPDPDHRGRHLYQLTQASKDLWPVVHSLLVWGDRYRDGSCRVFQHAACGTPLDDSGTCPHRKIAPGPDDILAKPLRRTSRDDPVARALRRMLDPVPERRAAG